MCCYFKLGQFLLETEIYGTLALGDNLDLVSLEESEINFKGSHLFLVHGINACGVLST